MRACRVDCHGLAQAAASIRCRIDRTPRLHVRGRVRVVRPESATTRPRRCRLAPNRHVIVQPVAATRTSHNTQRTWRGQGNSEHPVSAGTAQWCGSGTSACVLRGVRDDFDKAAQAAALASQWKMPAPHVCARGYVAQLCSAISTLHLPGAQSQRNRRADPEHGAEGEAEGGGESAVRDHIGWRLGRRGHDARQ